MKLYRFVDQGWNAPVYLETFEVTKETPAGYWIEDYTTKNGKRWVSKTGFKRYAYVEKKGAAESYVKRKHRQINILTTKLDQAKDNLSFFEKNQEKLVAEEPVRLIGWDNGGKDSTVVMTGTATKEAATNLIKYHLSVEAARIEPHTCVDDGGFLLGVCKICGELLSWP
jgi:hypothetical protein